jgi:hypothetical protein
MKRCSKCEEVKPLTEFHKNRAQPGGYQYYCKPCHIKSSREDRNKRLEDCRRYDRSPKRAAAKRDSIAKDPKGHALMASKSRSKWSANNQHKVEAHKILSAAIARGTLHKPDICSKCGATGDIAGHHEDYTKPLEVVWLCKLCHGELHRRERVA